MYVCAVTSGIRGTVNFIYGGNKKASPPKMNRTFIVMYVCMSGCMLYGLPEWKNDLYLLLILILLVAAPDNISRKGLFSLSSLTRYERTTAREIISCLKRLRSVVRHDVQYNGVRIFRPSLCLRASGTLG